MFVCDKEFNVSEFPVYSILSCIQYALFEGYLTPQECNYLKLYVSSFCADHVGLERDLLD